MSDKTLVDDALAAMIRKSGLKVRNDDPILLNAMVIQVMFQEQLEISRIMGDELIHTSGLASELTLEKYSKILAESAAAQSKNNAIFLESFREILANQAAEKFDMSKLADSLHSRLQGRFTWFLVAQAALLVVAAAAGYALASFG